MKRPNEVVIHNGVNWKSKITYKTLSFPLVSKMQLRLSIKFTLYLLDQQTLFKKREREHPTEEYSFSDSGNVKFYLLSRKQPGKSFAI